ADRPQLRERFQREARAAAALHHTHIVPIFDVGVCHGTPFYAMQLIEGAGLDALLRDLRQAPLPEAQEHARRMAELVAHVAEALDHAHRHGILHRDIKPSNLLLDRDGTVWVTDFGLARLAEETDLTRTGEVVGTVRYMAPERFQGQADARSDV